MYKHLDSFLLRYSSRSMSSKVIALIKHFFRLLDTTQDSLMYAFIKHTFLGTVDNKKKP